MPMTETPPLDSLEVDDPIDDVADAPPSHDDAAEGAPDTSSQSGAPSLSVGEQFAAEMMGFELAPQDLPPEDDTPPETKSKAETVTVGGDKYDQVYIAGSREWKVIGTGDGMVAPALAKEILTVQSEKRALQAERDRLDAESRSGEKVPGTHTTQPASPDPLLVAPEMGDKEFGELVAQFDEELGGSGIATKLMAALADRASMPLRQRLDELQAIVGSHETRNQQQTWVSSIHTEVSGINAEKGMNLDAGRVVETFQGLMNQEDMRGVPERVVSSIANKNYTLALQHEQLRAREAPPSRKTPPKPPVGGGRSSTAPSGAKLGRQVDYPPMSMDPADAAIANGPFAKKSR